jgi:MFS superfamily sulfate permease-like transporter
LGALTNSSTGTTVGAVVVPQSMAYAQLAELPVEYGLYSSFMGVLLYWFFATSKDITIGVGSQWFLYAPYLMLIFSSLSLSCPK